jgi:trans-L-3-hydroxyproline dehydratase
MRVSTLDYHTGGEPLRIVTGGLPEIPGNTMLARRRFMQENLDHYRRFLMLEPRGHADMYGAVLTQPVTRDADIGVLFLHNEGYSTMCGHGIIALVTAGLEQRLFEIKDPSAVRIDTPAGRITGSARVDETGKVESVSFRNVPSFVLHSACPVEVEGRSIDCVIAFGGAFYAYVDAALFGLELAAPEASRMIRLGQQIKNEINRQDVVRHPSGDEDLNFLYGTIFVLQDEKANRSRNACVFADGELDRSPTGTGVSGRAAIHYARGELGLGEILEIDSFIGSRFTVRCLEETTVGGLPAVIPEVTGSAHISGEHQFILDERDPLGGGFLIR